MNMSEKIQHNPTYWVDRIQCSCGWWSTVAEGDNTEPIENEWKEHVKESKPMPSTDTRTCKDCPFWGADLGYEGTTEHFRHCMLNPPHAKHGFPRTLGYRDWCSVIRPGLKVEKLEDA